MNKRVLVVGGSKEFSGAPQLAGVAALRYGAESVLVMTPEKVAWAINASSPDLMTYKLEGDYLSMKHEEVILKKLETADILVIGNGATTHPETLELMRSLSLWYGPKVIDADALRAIESTEINNAILTPNTGEWEYLNEAIDIDKFVASQDIVVVQKGKTTKVFDGSQIFEQKVNEGLHKAGMGDVLAGLCAASLAKGLPLFEAAKDAVKVGSKIAANIEDEIGGKHFLASDVANFIDD